MEGFLQENGPIVVDDDTHSIYHNDHSWNKRANVLYLESPAGVGFSKGFIDTDVTHSDISQSNDTFNALRIWYDDYKEFK